MRCLSKDLNAFDIIFKTIEYVKKNPEETESLFRMLLLFSYQRSVLFFFDMLKFEVKKVYPKQKASFSTSYTT